MRQGVLRSQPIAVYLFLLATVAILPLLIFAGLLLQRNNEAQESVVQTLTVGTTQAIMQAVDRRIESNITILRILSTSPEIDYPDKEQFYIRANSALAGTGSHVVLLNDRFQQLINTRVPYGEPLGVSNDPDTMTKAIASNQIVFSDVRFSPTAQAWIAPVIMPRTARDGSQQLLAINEDTRNINAALISRQLPEGWNVALVDAKDLVVTASDGTGIGAGTPFFIPRNQPVASSSWRRERVEGNDLYVINWTSPLTGWRVVSWASAATVERPLTNSLVWLVLGGVALTGAASITTFMLAREIRRSVRGLALDAKRLGAGEHVEPQAYPVAEIATVSIALGEASRRRDAAESEVRFLMRELAHRSKNQMTVIASMARQTAKHTESLPEFLAGFEKRIFGLARSTDLLLAHGMAGVELEELFTQQLEPFGPSGRQVSLSGPAQRLNTHAAQTLGMAAHELATNAAKYGAFSAQGGQLAVTWTKAGDMLELVWREKVATPPQPSTRTGFGTTVLQSMMRAALGATVERTLHQDGIEWRFTIPLAAIDPDLAPHGDEAETADVDDPARPRVVAAG